MRSVLTDVNVEEEAPQTAGDEGKKGGVDKIKRREQKGKGVQRKEGGNQIMKRQRQKKSRDRLKNNASDIRRGESEDKHFFFLPFCH